MLNLLLCLVVAFTATFFALPVVIATAENKGLFDAPDARKVHRKPIASLGGVGIFAGFMLACLLFIPVAEHPEFQYYLGAAFIIFFLGLKDDILAISPAKKFAGQLLAAIVLVGAANLVVTDLHGFLGIGTLPYWLAAPLTVVAIVFIINAFNLIDGIDGLAGTLGVVTTVLFGFYFYKNEFYAEAGLAFAAGGGLLAFLSFNYQPARIFMGDTGSLFTGLVNAILVIRFINTGADSTVLQSSAAPAVGFAVLMIPVLDTFRVFVIRIWQGRSPFSPDKIHVHHLLLAKGLSHNRTTVVLFCLNVLTILGVYFCQWMGTTLLVSMVVVIYLVFIRCVNAWRGAGWRVAERKADGLMVS